MNNIENYLNQLNAEERKVLKERIYQKELLELQVIQEKHDIRINKLEDKTDDMTQKFIDNSVTQRHNEIYTAFRNKAEIQAEKHFNHLKNKEHGELWFSEKIGHISFYLFKKFNKEYGVSEYKAHIEKNVDLLLEHIRDYEMNEKDLKKVSSYLPKDKTLKAYLADEYKERKKIIFNENRKELQS